MTTNLLHKLDRLNRVNFLHSFRLYQRITIRAFSSNEDEIDKAKNNKQSEQADAATVKSQTAKDKLKNLLLSIPKVKELNAQKTEESGNLNYKFAVPQRISRKQREKEREEREAIENKGPKLSEEFLKAVKSVAASIEGDPVVTESELIQKLKSQAVGPKINMNDLFAGMVVDKNKPQRKDLEESRAERVRHILQDSKHKRTIETRDSYSRDLNGRPQSRRRLEGSSNQRIDLFNEKPLGIFTRREVPTKESTSVLEIWDKLDRKEMEISTTHPPANGFEEMILWTKKGKLWKFPINNEDGMEEENNTSFEDHVFLELKIDPWCPKKGPIRHFMELVCVGLAKNPFWTAKEKDNLLTWYRDFFKGKQAILTDLGIGEIK